MMISRGALAPPITTDRVARRGALGLALLVLAGCSEATEPAAAGPATPGPPPPTHRTVVHEVVWPAAGALDAAALATLPEAARRAVSHSPVPVLVLTAPPWLKASQVMTKTHWYALAAHHDGLSVALRGLRLAHRYSHVTPARGRHTVRGRPAFIGMDARIWSASWVEGGVSYSLDLECASAADTRCDDDGELRRLSKRLGYVGGAGQEGTP